MIRLSIGIEHIDDIQALVDQALANGNGPSFIECLRWQQWQYN